MSSTFVWTTRCVPALSVCLVGILLVTSFIISPYGKGARGDHNGNATVALIILSVYTLFLHILSVAFPKMRAAGNDIPTTRRRCGPSIKNEEGRYRPSTLLFVIILPVYKEEMATLEETLRFMASHVQACSSYHVYLAMEEEEEEAKLTFKAATLCRAFEKLFFRISYTLHPSNIPGEARGKSSDESYLAAIECYESATKPILKFTPGSLATTRSLTILSKLQGHTRRPLFEPNLTSYMERIEYHGCEKEFDEDARYNSWKNNTGIQATVNLEPSARRLSKPTTEVLKAALAFTFVLAIVFIFFRIVSVLGEGQIGSRANSVWEEMKDMFIDTGAA
ncbi:hypothetical protein M409DRAFT_61653 [Zasmidium cellare ATCC 36951]|uniref:Glycosyltransferase family 2 protein n=1 Tax=Zasmidium cellare ATCC 36951 TaxID=1080233 RepID=A0A6A6BUF9_ZASCE|nr:uncharacterized protein M409DRAFT_61653 [Zasmidium cellare ATCC 36951]KAF2158437.1 hypothetical protein M409DRAFT_61653 [Zasmidium cellare ATCC 36951]